MHSVIFLETSRWSCWFIGKFAKGALSNETEYKKELDGYMSSHNVIFGMKRGKRLTLMILTSLKCKT